MGVAFLIIFTNLPSPEADFAAMPIIAVATLTNAPLFLVYFAVKIYSRIRARFFGGGQQNELADGPVKVVPDEDKPMISNRVGAYDDDNTPAISI